MGLKGSSCFPKLPYCRPDGAGNNGFLSYASPEGLLYLFEEKSGNVGLAKPSTEKLDIVSEFRLPTKSEGPYWAHPVIHNGRLYVRHGDYLAVYSIRN